MYTKWNRWLLVPVLLDFEGPIPAEVISFIVICELALDGVLAAVQDPGRRLFHRSKVLVQVGLRTITSHHEVGVVNCKVRSRFILDSLGYFYRYTTNHGTPQTTAFAEQTGPHWKFSSSPMARWSSALIRKLQLETTVGSGMFHTFYAFSVWMLNVFESSHDVSLDIVLNFEPVLHALLYRNGLLLQIRQVSCKAKLFPSSAEDCVCSPECYFDLFQIILLSKRDQLR